MNPDRDWTLNLELARTAAMATGTYLRRQLGTKVVVDSDRGRDIKAAADREAERLVLELLAPAGWPILSEESGASVADCVAGTCWIVDPLDGTFNFVRGFPLCGVSIALWDGRRPVLGVVYDLATGDCYSGMPGRGAFRNQELMQVSNLTERSQAVLATGFPSGRDFGDASLQAMLQRVQAYKKIRMIGAASLSLAQVAAGRFDAYAEEDIRLWDVAAGWALVEAAGGQVNCSPIRPEWKVDMVAWNGRFEPGL